MTFNVQVSGSPVGERFTINGDNLLDAVKLHFPKIIEKCSFQFVPFRYPMTVTPSYEKGILGGRGGVSLKLEWMYAEYQNRPPIKRDYSVWIYAEESDLTDLTPFVVE